MTTKDQAVRMTVTWGAEKYAPIQYHSFDVGPFSVSVECEKGTLTEQHAKAVAVLKNMAAAQFEEQLAAFLGRAKKAAAAARGGGR